MGPVILIVLNQQHNPSVQSMFPIQSISVVTAVTGHLNAQLLDVLESVCAPGSLEVAVISG